MKKGSEFYNRSLKSSLIDDDIEMYSKHNEGKSVVAERFFRTLETLELLELFRFFRNLWMYEIQQHIS